MVICTEGACLYTAWTRSETCPIPALSSLAPVTLKYTPVMAFTGFLYIFTLALSCILVAYTLQSCIDMNSISSADERGYGLTLVSLYINTDTHTQRYTHTTTHAYTQTHTLARTHTYTQRYT